MKTNRCHSRGFSLVEVIVAIGVLAIAVLFCAEFVRLGAGSGRRAASRREALQAADAILAHLRSRPFVEIQPLLSLDPAEPLERWWASDQGDRVAPASDPAWQHGPGPVFEAIAVRRSGATDASAEAVGVFELRVRWPVAPSTNVRRPAGSLAVAGSIRR